MHGAYDGEQLTLNKEVSDFRKYIGIVRLGEGALLSQYMTGQLAQNSNMEIG